MSGSDLKPDPDQRSSSPSRFSRRGVLFGGSALVLAAGYGSARWFNVTGALGPGDMTVQDAHRAALAGDVLLVDIRRPDEWDKTGVGEGAIPLDMRRPDFVDAILVHTEGRKDMPIALICARGVRSARLTARLAEAGFTQIRNVPEGMFGSGAGPGWLNAKLPVVAVPAG